MTLRRRLLRPSRPVLLLFAGVVLAGSVAVNRAARGALLPAELGLLPSQNGLIVATGDLATLWARVEEHFGPAIRDTRREHEGPLRSMVLGARDLFKESNVPITVSGDLTRYGFDVNRGMAVSVSGLGFSTEGLQARGTQFVVVLPASDERAVRTFLASLRGAAPSPVTDADDLTSYNVVQLGEDDEAVYVATPGPGLVVVASSMGMLRRSLLEQNANRRAFLEDDALYDGVSQLLGRPLLQGPAVAAFWRPPGTPIRYMTLTTDLRAQDVVISADVGLIAGTLRVIDQFNRSATSRGEWASWLPANTIAAVAAQEKTLTQYLDLAASIPALESVMRSFFGGLLLDLQAVDDFSRLVLAVTGYPDGVPDVLIGVWADPAAVSARIDALRVRAARERDLALLRAASARVPGGLTPRALIDAGALQPEAAAAWAGYKLANNAWTAPPDMAYVFDAETYSATHEGVTIRYITPPLGRNDKELRSEFASADPDLLASDRYRLATATAENVTWLSIGSGTLRKVIDSRAGRAPQLSQSALFGTARGTWASGDKLQLFINVEELAATATFDAGEELDSARNALLDFQQQPSIAASLRPSRGRDAVRLLWTMTRVRPVN